MEEIVKITGISVSIFHTNGCWSIRRTRAARRNVIAINRIIPI
jgi:hypothetical protein